MRIIRTEKQRENLARFCWNMAQITLGALVVAPLARPESMETWVVVAGIGVTAAFVILGYVLDGMEVQQWKG